MNILYFSSDLFARVTAVSIVSLLENNKDADFIKIYYVDDGISDDTKSELLKITKRYGRSLNFIPAPDPNEIFQFPFENRYQLGHSYMRMCVGSLLPDSVERILVLDSDTLVVGNLSELWQMKMNGMILAGVADCFNLKAYSKRFLMTENDIYCNAGMFLINLKEWRYYNVENKIRNVIKEHNGNIFFFEQTLMSSVCKGKIIKLKPNFNCYTSMYAFTHKNVIRWRRPINYYSEEEVHNALKYPSIIHFTRNFYMTSRPWVEGCEHPMTSRYLEYKKMTPWPSAEKDSRNLKKRIEHKLLHCIPQSILAYIICVLYNEIRPRMFWRNE